MPATLTHDRTEIDAYFLTPQSQLEGLWGALGAHRAEWFRARRRRLIVPSVVLQVANLAMLISSLSTPGASSTSFTATQLTVSVTAMWFSALCGFGFPIVPGWVRSSQQYLSAHDPGLLGQVPAMRHLTQFGPVAYRWRSPGPALTDAQLIDSLAAFSALGGFDGIPAPWLTDTSPTVTEAFTLLGYDTWLEQHHLPATAREVYDQLLGEYDGTLGELLRTSRSLAS
jgi:hypothetical protein